MNLRSRRTRILAPAFRILLMALPFMTAACEFNAGPYPMATGYTYHHQAYKSQRGPASEITEESQLALIPGLYDEKDSNIMIDRTALEQVGKTPPTAQSAQPVTPVFTRVVE